MKKLILSYLNFLVLFSLLFTSHVEASELSSRLKGKILLQVEKNGEAWYVNPDDEKRYYLGRPQDAFNLMRGLGLGISNNDFDLFGEYAPERLLGKILLKAEDSGKAYYVNPDDLKMHYLGRPADAFQVMRELGLGITNDNLNGIARYTDNSSWTTCTSDNFHFTISHPNTWMCEKNNSGDPYILLSKDTARIIVSPQGDIGRGLWMDESIITNITIDGTTATREDWHLANGQMHAQIKFTDIPQNWNKHNNIIIENLQDNNDVIENILYSIEFVK